MKFKKIIISLLIIFFIFSYNSGYSYATNLTLASEANIVMDFSTRYGSSVPECRSKKISS